MYYISDIKILSNQANIEIMDSIGTKFYIKEVSRSSNKITVRPTRPLKKGTLQGIEQEIKDIIRGGWNTKDVELEY
jgi:hypothetical protein